MCETMFTDTNALQKLSSQLKKTDKSLWGKIKSFFGEWIAKLKKAYAGMSPDSELAKIARDTLKNAENLQQLWVDAAVGAAQNYRQASEGQKNNTAGGHVLLSKRAEEQFKLLEDDIRSVVTLSISSHGKINEAYNQHRISEMPKSVSEMVAKALGIDELKNKYVAVEGGSIWHEYQRRSDSDKERDRGQIAMTIDDFVNAIKVIYEPDRVEALFSTANNPTQRLSFAYAKKRKAGIMSLLKRLAEELIQILYQSKFIIFQKQNGIDG